jgi:outer membrane protein assembly factor BamB
VVYHGIVFVTSSSDLFAFQVDSGKLRWSYIPVESPSLSGVVQPVVAAGLIVIGVPPWKVYAVNP